MRFPANCLVMAILGSMLPGHKFNTERNRKGRLHFFWTDAYGCSWEFYKKGASAKGYLRNSLYLGEIKRKLPEHYYN